MVFGQKKVEDMSEGWYIAFEVSDPWCGGSLILLKGTINRISFQV